MRPEWIGVYECVAIAFLIGYLLSAVASPACAQSVLKTLKPDELLRLESHRASSNDASGGNDDYYRFAPGERKAILAADGASGVITRFWCTINSDADNYLQDVRLRMAFDETRTVDDVPVGMFFASGPWRVNDVVSDRVNIMRARPGNKDDSGTGRGSFNSHWEMAFARSARVELTNGTDKPMTLHFNIDYVTGMTWEAPPCLFHARHGLAHYTEAAGSEKTLDASRNYVLANISGQEGFYAGTVLCVESHPSRDGKWYEGDESFTIDGAPWGSALHGTGTEDYFGMAWGIHRSYQAFDHGVAHYERNLTEDDRFYDGRFVLYRWHVTDPIIFRASLHASIEAGHANDCVQHYESVAFWYGRDAEPRNDGSNPDPTI